MMDVEATAVPALLDIREQTARARLMNVYRTLVKTEAHAPYVIQQLYNVNVCFFNILPSLSRIVSMHTDVIV